jgi:tetrahydromethanopterin S-methyltransferase subunit B
MVIRDGGAVALQLLSDKIDRVQSTVDRTAAELALQRLGREFDELSEKHVKLEDLAAEMKKSIDQLFYLGFPVAGGVTLACFFSSAALGIILGIVLIGGVVTLWLHKRKENDTEMQLNAKPLFDKGIEIKKKIVELEKFIVS